MSVLLIAEITDGELAVDATAKAMAAASQMGPVTVLCAGATASAAADEAAKLSGATKVLLAEDALYGHRLAEPVADLIVSLAGDYSHIVAPATTDAKNILPRVAALLDVMVMTDVTAVVDADTFERPIYAGNAMQTVKSSDAKKVMTIRTSTFEGVAMDGSAAVEAIGAAADPALSEWVEDKVATSDRPELTSAGIVVSADTFERPIYAGNAIQTVKSSDAKKVVSVRTSTFAAAGEGGSAAVETISAAGNGGLSSWIEDKVAASDRPELTSAGIVVSGGRGVGSEEQFSIIENLADKLGGAVGASRAAVDSGYAPNDWQVGQTGKVVAPDLYVAVGISGAIQHLAGMKDSKIIVAINKDEEAPIFQVADYGLVADLFTAVPELMEKL